MTRICEISDCGNKHYSRGWCGKHYQRWKRNGDPVGMLITQKGKPLEFINLAINSNTDDCILWPYNKSCGYGLVKYKGKKEQATRVCLILSENPPPTPTHHAAHLPVVCHNRACINPRHLRWATRKENMHDKVLDGTHQCGESIWNSKLTEEQVLMIRKDTRRHKHIADDYDISPSTISLIKRRKNWAWLEDRTDLQSPHELTIVQETNA